MKRPKYFTFPTISMWFMTLVSSYLAIMGILEGRYFWTSVAWAGILAFFVGIPLGIFFTDFLFGYELNRVTFPDLNRLNLSITAVHKENGSTEMKVFHDVFREIKPEKWQEIAKNILVNENFTVATVGQVERPKLIPIFLKKKYITALPHGRYDPTKELYDFCHALSTTPPLTIAFRRLIQNNLRNL